VAATQEASPSRRSSRVCTSIDLEDLGLRRRPLLGADPQRWLGETEQRFAALRTRGGYAISADVERLVALSLERLAARWPELERGPFTLVHDALHIQNFLLDLAADAEPRVIFLDWQDATLGHPVRDLCQLLGGNTRPDVQRQHGPTLLRDYHRVLTEHGAGDWSHAQSARDLSVAGARLALGYVRFLSEYTARSPSEQTTLDHEWRRMLTMLQVTAEFARVEGAGRS